MNLAFLLAIFAMIVWVAKINSDLAKFKEMQKNHEHERRLLIEKAERYQKLIEKIESNQVRSKKRVDDFIATVRDARDSDSINKLLDEAFGSYVNRGDVGSE